MIQQLKNQSDNRKSSILLYSNKPERFRFCFAGEAKKKKKKEARVTWGWNGVVCGGRGQAQVAGAH